MAGFARYNRRMNVDSILSAMNRRGVEYLLIGGVNYMLRHRPVLTFDVDLWIEDVPENRQRCVQALVELDAEWGPTEQEWGPVTRLAGDWLSRQPVFSFLTKDGPLDVFRAVKGLESWSACAARARQEATPAGVAYRGLSDRDMLACQLALEEPLRKLDRIRHLETLLGQNDG